MSSAEQTEHLEQARHNERFLKFLIETAENYYFDWKVTVTFYAALHLMRAFLCKENKNPGGSHHDILLCINPRPHEPVSVHCPLPKLVFNAFKDLYMNSKSARYNGFLHLKDFNEYQKLKLADCTENLQLIKLYLMGRGLKIKEVKSPTPGLFTFTAIEAKRMEFLFEL